jgi:uncharacterized protein YbaP (TraB family)
MYCSNCQCDSCRAQRAAAAAGAEGNAAEALRLISKAGEEGRTLSELEKYSRHLRAMGKEPLAQLIDSLEVAGLVVKHRHLAPKRGKYRDAFLAVQVSQ